MASTLKQGSRGDEVTQLQQLLNQNGANLNVDGIYGPLTAAAVKQYQTGNALKVDGITGAQTWGALTGASSASSASNLSYVPSGADYGGGYYSGGYDAGYSGGYSGGSASTLPLTQPAGYTQFDYDMSDLGAAPPEYVEFLYQLKNAGADIKLPDYRNFQFAADGTPATAPGQVQGQYTLNDLMNDLQRDNYTPLTIEQMKQQADNRYSEAYNTQRLAAQQGYQTADQGLEQQYLGLERAYNDAREQSAIEYDNAYAKSNRQSLTTGMQRSSFNNQILANIDAQGAQAQERLYERQIGDQNQIESQRALLARQLGERLEQMTASEIADKLSYQDQLEAREYDRTVANQDRNNALTQGVYDRSQAEAAQTNQFNQWAAEFETGSQQWYDQLRYNATLADWQGQNQYDQFNASLQEQQRQFNEGLLYDAEKSSWQGLNSYNQWAANLTESQRQFNEQMMFNEAQNNWSGINNYNQWSSSFYENQRQYEQSFAENARQFGMDYALKQQQMAVQQQQFMMEYQLSQQQLAAQMSAQQAAASRSSGGGGGGGGGGSTGASKQPGLSADDIRKMIDDAMKKPQPQPTGAGSRGNLMWT